MKKLLGICICLLLVCVAIIPTVAIADTNITEDIIHFMSPTALAVEDDTLYVADNIEAGTGVIHRFDLSQATPQLVSSLRLSAEISNISVADGTLYAMSGSKVFEIDVATSGDTELELQGKDLGNVIDAAVYKDSLILFAESGLYIYSADSGYIPQSTKNPIACITSGQRFYYLYGENSSTVKRLIKNEAGFVGETDGVFNNHLQWPTGFQAVGMFAWGEDEVAIFGKHDIYTSASAGSTYNMELLKTFDDFVIKDAYLSNNKLCVLTRNNQVKIFSVNNNELTETDVTIGSDTYAEKVPTDYTTFTLVRVRNNGYPANIVFKTAYDNTIGEIVTDATEYIVIGYPGDENSNYYYVLLGDKFGWVKKNDNADSVENDDRLEIVNTNAGDEEHAYKVVSLNAMYVSPLPREFFYNSASYRKVYPQEGGKKIQNVVVTQKFTEKDTVWYYITFEYDGATHSGFVRDRDVKLTIAATDNAQHEIIGARKVNSILFSTVDVYVSDDPATMNENNYLYDKDENRVKLSSGSRVLLISEKDGVAYIQIVKTGQCGYVYADRLIGEHQLTTNAAVGITLLVIAVALGVTLTVVFVRRKRRNKASAPTTTSEEK